MGQEELHTLVRFFKALADETRLRILGILAGRECSVEELAAMLGVKAPTVSHHLARLKELSLVEMRPEGKCTPLPPERGGAARDVEGYPDARNDHLRRR